MVFYSSKGPHENPPVLESPLCFLFSQSLKVKAISINLREHSEKRTRQQHRNCLLTCWKTWKTIKMILDKKGCDACQSIKVGKYCIYLHNDHWLLFKIHLSNPNLSNITYRSLFYFNVDQLTIVHSFLSQNDQSWGVPSLKRKTVPKENCFIWVS